MTNQQRAWKWLDRRTQEAQYDIMLWALARVTEPGTSRTLDKILHEIAQAAAADNKLNDLCITPHSDYIHDMVEMSVE